MKPKQANVGDYVRLKNWDARQQIIHVMPALFGHDEWEYELESGMILMGYEFAAEDVEDEAWEHQL